MKQRMVKCCEKTTTRFMVNGREYQIAILPSMTLLEVLRDDINLMGTKYSCGSGECGACTVLVDGSPTLSCLTLAITAREKSILTIEGLSQGATLHPI